MDSPIQLFLCLLMAISTSAHSYQHVRFVNNVGSSQAKRSSISARNVRSFDHFQPIVSPFPELWPDEILWTDDRHLLEYTIPSSSFDNNFYSFNGIEKNGLYAKLVPPHIQQRLQKGLYFSDIPHVKLLLRYQQIRRRNCIHPVRLGSLRRDSPFTRTRYSYFHQG